MADAKELENKVATYQKALADTIKELTQKRTELGALSRQTVENLETSIPSLRKQVANLEAQLTKLDKEIADKNAIYIAKKEDLDSHYKNLERLLKEEYISRKANLDVKEKFQELKAKEQGKRDNELSLRDTQLKNDNDTLVNLREVFNKQVDDFGRQQNIETQKIEALKAEALKTRDSIKEKEESISLHNELLSKKSAELSAKIKEAEATIARISEVNDILAAAQARALENTKREEELNQQHIKLLADVKSQNFKRDALDSREASLNERDSNLKIAESALIKG